MPFTIGLNLAAGACDPAGAPDVSAPQAPIGLVAPSLTGPNAQAGVFLALDPGQWSGVPAPTLVVEYFRDGARVAAPDPAGYQTTPADEGFEIVARVTASNGVGAPAQASSNAVLIAPPSAAPVLLDAPQIVEDTQDPFALVVNNAVFAGAESLATQWRVGGEANVGETGERLDISALGGQSIDVAQIATGAGQQTPAISAPVIAPARELVPLGAAVAANAEAQYLTFGVSGQSNTIGGEEVAPAIDRAWTPRTFAVLGAPNDAALQHRPVRLVEPLESEGAAGNSIGFAKSFADALAFHAPQRLARRDLLMLRYGRSGSGFTTNPLAGLLQGFDVAAHPWAHEWAAGVSYAVGDILHHAGLLYVVSEAHVAPALFDAAASSISLRPRTGNWIPGVGDLCGVLSNRLGGLRAHTPNTRFGGWLHMQGESDVDTLSSAQYFAEFGAYAHWLRAETATPDLPIVVGGMVPMWRRGDPNKIARQADIAATPGRIAFTGYADPSVRSDFESEFDPEELGFNDEPSNDAIHFGAASHRRYGRRFFGGWLAALTNAAPGETTMPAAPAAVADLHAVGGQGEMALSWSRPDNGGAAIQEVELQVSDDGGQTWLEVAPAPVSEGYTHAGLPDNAARRYRLRYLNDAGAAPWSNIAAGLTSSAFDPSIGRLNHITATGGAAADAHGAAVTFSGAIAPDDSISSGHVLRASGEAHVVQFPITPTVDFTYAMWCKPSSLSVLSGYMAENSRQFLVLFNNPVNDNARVWGGLGGASNTSRGSLSVSGAVGVWVHLAFTYTAADETLRLYINGAQADADVTPVSSRLLGASVFTTGYATSGVAGGNAFNGDIAAISRYGRALSAAEILELYGAGR